MTLDAVLSRIDAGLDGSLDRLFGLLRIPSISTDPAYKHHCQEAAEYLAAELNAIGFEASVRPSAGHPMVIAHSPKGKGRRILFYGHYDVQPVDPLSLWTRDPFDPVIEDTPKGRVIRARGAEDDKGQLMTFVEAFRAWKEVTGALPENITLFFEGEEECGSPSLIPFMKDNAEELRCDLAVICDTGMYGRGKPCIVTMLRGLLGEELTIRAANRDLHSGMFGGIAMNPVRVLSKIIASLHDETGRITVPGFYDGVNEVPDEVRAQWQSLGFDHASFLGDVGLSVPAGEQDRTPLEMIWSRPTCDVNGIWGGYTGEGFKTVLPGEASAKISFRLVGTQDPFIIRENFREMVRAMLPADCEVTFRDHSCAPAAQMQIGDPAFDAALQALTAEWGAPATYTGSGGSIPIGGYFKDILGMDSLLIGFGLEDDNIHSPNEKYDLESFYKGIRSWARIIGRITG